MEEIKTAVGANRGAASVIPLEKGNIPPQAVDLEEAVLGAMLIDKKGVDEVIDILQGDAFYKTILAQSSSERSSVYEQLDLPVIFSNASARNMWKRLTRLN